MTGEQTIKAFAELQKEIPKLAAIANLTAMNNLNGELHSRIFNDGKASDGSSMGKYKSNSYAKKRASRGLQIQKKDLQFTGNLSKAIKIGVSQKELTLGIVKDERGEGLTSGKISEYQETSKQVGKTIFKPTQKELDKFNKTVTNKMTELLSKRIKELFK